jgi:hypothetical protein
MNTRPRLINVALVLAFVACCSPVVHGQDAAVYRGYQLGMTVAEVAAKAGVPVTEAKVVFERPMLIEELEWRSASLGLTAESGGPDSVGLIVFGFYKGELYRLVVTYRAERTEGLTERDLIDALSTAYGRPVTAPTTIITSPAGQTYTDTGAVLARWEDARGSVNLFRSAYGSSFGLVIYSKALAPLARVAIDKGLELNRQDAPRRELAAQKSRDDLESATHAKARDANKAAFRF